MDSATTPRATGFPGRNRSPSSSTTMAATPKPSTARFVEGSWPHSTASRSKNPSPPPFTPKSLGSCVVAMVSAAPALKPRRMVSLMKFTSELSRKTHASRHIAATTSAVSAAICAHRPGSPAAMSATVTPTSREIAEVGPIASWRDEPKSA